MNNSSLILNFLFLLSTHEIIFSKVLAVSFWWGDGPSVYMFPLLSDEENTGWSVAGQGVKVRLPEEENGVGRRQRRFTSETL